MTFFQARSSFQSFTSVDLGKSNPGGFGVSCVALALDTSQVQPSRGSILIILLILLILSSHFSQKSALLSLFLKHDRLKFKKKMAKISEWEVCNLNVQKVSWRMQSKCPLCLSSVSVFQDVANRTGNQKWCTSTAPHSTHRCQHQRGGACRSHWPRRPLPTSPSLPSSWTSEWSPVSVGVGNTFLTDL